MQTVWYELLDEHGLAYKQTPKDKVKVADDVDAAEFKELVKAKNQNKLAFIDASNLTVYKNRTEFEGTPKSAMDEDDPVSGLGASKKDALIVVVPASQGIYS
jgi:hypothetical protein